MSRIVRWEKDRLRYKADPRHVEKLTRDLGMEECKSLTISGTKPTTSSAILDDVGPGGGVPSVASVPEPLKLDRDGMKLYRSAVARCNYLAADRYETAFTTNELCRSMSSPSVDDLTAINRLCRFLKGLPRIVQRIDFSDFSPTVIKAHVDSDWAGCRKTRKSTSGGVLMLGTTAVRGWSTNQAVIAMSSGEVEHYVALKGASNALGYQSMLKDIGLHASVTLYSDSSAARGIIHRVGLGKLRHLETGYLWLQSAVAKKRLQVRKVNGPENPADLFTKHLTNADMWKHMCFLQMSSDEGRSDVVPRI